MLVEDWRPQIIVDGVQVDNASANKVVLFRDADHKYFHREDIIKGFFTSFEDSKYKFRSPTGMIADFYEEFDTIPEAKKYVKKHKLPITWEQLVFAWEYLGDFASEAGTLLHGYAEALWNDWKMPRPTHLKVPFIEAMMKELLHNHTLVRTELLTYSLHYRLAGQVDLLLKEKFTGNLALMDYKFINELEMKSYFNYQTRKYKMMSGPFSRLQDCAHNHYSIQMSLYKMLLPKSVRIRVKSKTLLVVSPTGYELVEGRPMQLWVDKEGILQAKYRDGWKRLYNSSEDDLYLQNPYIVVSNDKEEELNSTQKAEKDLLNKIMNI